MYSTVRPSRLLRRDLRAIVIEIVLGPGPPIAGLRIANEEQDLAALRQLERQHKACIVCGIVHCERQRARIGGVVGGHAAPAGVGRNLLAVVRFVYDDAVGSIVVAKKCSKRGIREGLVERDHVAP